MTFIKPWVCVGHYAERRAGIISVNPHNKATIWGRYPRFTDGSWDPQQLSSWLKVRWIPLAITQECPTPEPLS